MPYNEKDAQRDLQQIRLAERQQQQLEAGYQRSVERMDTQRTSIFDDKLAVDTFDTTPFFLQKAPLLEGQPLMADSFLEERTESRSERKKRESLEKQRRKAKEAVRIADRKEGGRKTLAFREARRRQGDDVPMSSEEQKREQKILDRRLTAIDEQEKADILSVELEQLQRKNAGEDGVVSPENSAQAQQLQIRWKAQIARVEAYSVMAAQMPLGSQEREKMLKTKEEAVLKAGRLKREYNVACMPEGLEKSREAATIVRHGRYDFVKRVLRKPSPYSREDAAVTIENGKTLINVGRATLGGTKAMYVFEDRSELVNGKPQEWLFKEATNCIGFSKPAGAVVTGEASKLQQFLRGELSIPAQCLRDEQGKVVGSVQKRIQKVDGGVDLFKWQAQQDLRENPPWETTLADLMHEHTLDWVLCNFDTKGENFINQSEGHIISFDKEASFNTLLQAESHHMSYNFKPHSNDTIYNTMFCAFAQGQINLDLNANIESIRKLKTLGADDFIGMFKETLDVKYKPNTEDRALAEQILRDRIESLEDEYCRFYTDLIEERMTHFAGDTPEEQQERQRLQSMLVDGRFVFSERI